MRRGTLLTALGFVFLASCSASSDQHATLVVLGDSLTAPIGNDEADWLKWADPDGRFELLANAGNPGERTDQILNRVERDVIARQPDWCTVLAGTNDIGQDVDALQIIANLTSIYDALRGAGIGIIALTIPPAANLSASQAEVHQAVNDWLRAHVAQDWPGAVLADWSAALSIGGDGLEPIPEYFLADGVHFNGTGARAAGEAVRATFAAIDLDQPVGDQPEVSASSMPSTAP